MPFCKHTDKVFTCLKKIVLYNAKKKLAILISTLDIPGAKKVLFQVINSFIKNWIFFFYFLTIQLNLNCLVNDSHIKFIDNSNLK